MASTPHHFLVEGPGGLNVVKQAGAYYSNLPIYAPILDNGGQVFNVKATPFGAAGDGTTDDSKAFNAAQTAATLVGGTVAIPNGTYVLNPTVLNNITANLIGQSLGGVRLKLQSQYNTTDNLIRVVSQDGLVVGNFTLDGNKSANTGNQYGLFFSTNTNCTAYNIVAHDWNGVGIHFYNNTRCTADNLWSTTNVYHGFEFEQNTRCKISNINGYGNTLHGVLVSPGEVAGTGSHSNVFSNLQCNSNGNYGLAFNAANGDISAWLSEGDQFNNVVCMNNAFYGLNIYKQDKQTFNGVTLINNGYFGIYLYQTQYNTFNGLFMHNNSQATNGGYDEILVEGYNDNHSHPSAFNVFNGGQIIIDGTNKARYAFNEGSANDGPNTFVNINVPNAGTVGKVNQLVGNDLISSPGGVLQVGDFQQSIAGANAGIDSAFSHVMRIYNNFAGGNTQVVTPNGNFQYWTGGNHIVDINATNINMLGGILKHYVQKSGAYTMTTSDYGVLVDATSSTVTITLPTAVGVAGQEYTVKDWKGQAATHNITVATTSSQTIDGSTTRTLTANYQGLTVISDGANWSTIGQVSTTIL